MSRLEICRGERHGSFQREHKGRDSSFEDLVAHTSDEELDHAVEKLLVAL
jgi:hypothetical protein